MLPSEASLLGISAAEFTKLWKEACSALCLEVLGPPVPYQLRHTGASSDLIARRRTLAETKKRGRWADDRSLKRYTKGGRLAEQIHRLSAATRAHALSCDQQIGEILTGRSLPLRA